jgi:restriction system protein
MAGSSARLPRSRASRSPWRAGRVFLTTSAFSDEARLYAAGIHSKVALIDGAQLAESERMIDFDLGVSPATTYIVKRIDSDFFGEE